VAYTVSIVGSIIPNMGYNKI